MKHQLVHSNGATLTMTSREIAELVESRHDSVKRTIERCAEKGVFTLPPLVETSFRGVDGRGQTVAVYHLDKRSSLIVVAQLCPEFTARIVDRWQELEAKVAQPAPAIPDFSNPAIAARAWADQYEQRQAAEKQLALAAPKVEFVDRYVESTGLKSFRQVAKLLQANEARFRDFLKDKHIMYKLGGEWVAHQQHIDAGRFQVKAGTSEVSGHAFNSCRFTPKGVNWIAGLWAQYQLEVTA